MTHPPADERCPSCGVGFIRLTSGPGRKLPRDEERGWIILPDDLVVPECDHCHEFWTNGAIDDMLDALERV